MGGLSDAEFVAFVVASCERSGVPVRVVDAMVVEQVASVLQGRATRRLARRGVSHPADLEPPDEINASRA